MTEAELKARFPGGDLKSKISEIIKDRRKTDPFLSRASVDQRELIAYQLLRKELTEELQLPTFEEWRESKSQMEMFS
jgi:hypothetical protein